MNPDARSGKLASVPRRPARIALLYPGDRAMRDRADPAESRFAALFAAIDAAGMHAVPAVWHDDFADEVREQLQQVDAVLAWCNPIEGGRRRDQLDALLQEVADQGVLVSAHPEAVRRLGTKDVLVETRGLPFGSDVHRIDSLAQLERDLPRRLDHGARVLKQHRGHSGIGIWRVERADGDVFRVRHAKRDSVEERIDFAALCERLAPYFEPDAGGHMVDQPWQPRIAEGMVRAYLVGDRVAGFGHQAVNALHPDAPQPGPRLYHDAEMPAFQGLRHQLESTWIAQLRECVGLNPGHLPLLWDCDFMFGDPTPAEPERYVLCEINVSSVSPFPPSAIAPILGSLSARIGSGTRIAKQRGRPERTRPA
jgi:hypothetical protein